MNDHHENGVHGFTVEFDVLSKSEIHVLEMKENVLDLKI